MDYDWTQLQPHILQLEREGKVTRTFRRLDPDRQQAIIIAILDEAVEKGPTDLNIKQVAARAGVSVGSLYTYFENRNGLLAFTVELCVRFARDMFESYRPLLRAVPFREGIKLYVAGGMEWGKMLEGLTQFFARSAYHGESELSELVVRPLADTLLNLVREMLEHAIARGEVRASIDLDATSRLIHALTIAVADSQILPYLNTYFQIVGDDMPPDRIMDSMLELIMDGIGTGTQAT